jgi:hypothetical protein
MSDIALSHELPIEMWHPLENKGSATQVEVSPRAFLGAKLTCLSDSYTGIKGRRKKVIVRLLFNTVFDCRQKIRNKRRIKINPL